MSGLIVVGHLYLYRSRHVHLYLHGDMYCTSTSKAHDNDSFSKLKDERSCLAEETDACLLLLCWNPLILLDVCDVMLQNNWLDCLCYCAATCCMIKEDRCSCSSSNVQAIIIFAAVSSNAIAVTAVEEVLCGLAPWFRSCFPSCFMLSLAEA